MSDLALVSGCDSAYFALLRGTVRSVRAHPWGRAAALCILDAGLLADQRSWLADQGATILVPPPSGPPGSPGFVSMLAARPRIPDLFPGHAIYLWLDADAWVQEGGALRVYAEGARESGFCVTPERHPAYNAGELEAAHRQIRSWFGAETVRALEGTAPLNAGVFAAPADAPHWRAWSRRLDESLAAASTQEAAFQADQVALNLMIHGDGMSSTLLPARFNWLCHTAPPMASDDGSLLLDPLASHEPIAVVHMTLWAKRGSHELATLSGGKIVRPLTYGAEALPGDGGALPDFSVRDLEK